MKYRSLIILSLTVVAIVSAAVAPAGAIPAHALEAQQRAAEKQMAQREKQQEVRERVAATLDDKKKSLCKKREATIKRIMTNMQKQGEKQLEVFDKIADRTKQFYQNKKRVIDNYDDLTTAVDDKRQSAALAVAAGSEAIMTFSCDADDPITLKDMFKEQLNDQIAALKDYKTAIKDLIVGVKSAQGQASRDNSSDTDTAPSQGDQS